MKKTNELLQNPMIKKYTKYGIIAVAVIAVALIGVFTISGIHKNSELKKAISGVSAEAVTGAELRIAVVRMDVIQQEATVLKDLRSQRESYEKQLRSSLEKEQKQLEKEKAEIEKTHDMLSQEALQHRVMDYQNRVNKLQRDLSERAQSIEMSFQNALNTIQQKHLDPVIEAIIEKKNLSLVIDGRMSRVGKNVSNLDITKEVTDALNKKISSLKMAKPKGF
ncbi:MAG: OmpH family outer membrane protein [Alphaproteobacteria bacterium]|nr:OmpH family outer membrane protein [Alphaproteobacteria bacterium]